MKPNIDISYTDYELLLSLLQRYAADATVWAFGSRVKRTSRPQSDLDLAVSIAHNRYAVLADLREAFDEANLPFRVDVMDWDSLPENMKDNICQERVAIWNVV
ncbi:MAG: nucleotidyltransferase domain-containing protein [Prevotellaceae bacterium]|jgi:predicted nucleotidyltransferase|nr:nucleotidyltransferase domain-containing protein [Prevotellaceae bacterium]